MRTTRKLAASAILALAGMMVAANAADAGTFSVKVYNSDGTGPITGQTITLRAYDCDNVEIGTVKTTTNGMFLQSGASFVVNAPSGCADKTVRFVINWAAAGKSIDVHVNGAVSATLQKIYVCMPP